MLDKQEYYDQIEIKLSNNIKTEYSQNIEKELMDLANSTSMNVSLNFEDVTFVCSHFLKVCLRLNNTLTSERFCLEKLTPEIKRVFMIAGFDKILNLK